MRDLTNEQIAMMKENMKNTIDLMRSDNLEDCFKVLTSQYEVLKQLFSLESMMVGVGFMQTTQEIITDESVAAQETVDEPETIKAINDDIEELAMAEAPETPVEASQEVSESRPMYRVERKLRGAYVADINGFIPESVVRNEGIEHGDYVYAKPIGTNSLGSKHFSYALAKKSDTEIADDRVEYLYCPVEKDSCMYVVTKSSVTGEKIRVDEMPFTVKIDDADVERFDIKEGDVIDIAFYKNNPMGAKVIWKHDVQDLHSEYSDKPERKKKPKSSTQKPQEEVEQVFKGRTICIVGDKPNEASYRTLIEERGGELLHVEPKWNPSRIETFIKKADVVIGLYDVSCHIGLEKAKEFCKLYGVPFDMISGLGKSKVIQTAMDLINEQVSVSS